MKIKRYAWGAMALSGSALSLGSGPAAAQGQSASAAAMLEEVIVTARRREESLQELPLSIQAITADAMQAQGVYNIKQISNYVPNLVLSEDRRANDTQIWIRGLGGGFSNPAQVFGVGMYVDGHYLSGSLGAFMSTVDIDRVEVLRGPQGTLFGKNTTGGAISIISAKPGPEFDSYVTLRAADFGEQGVRAMVNYPVTDNFFIRANVAKEESDGFYFNRFTGEHTGGTDQQSIAVALRWEIGDSWTLDARFATADDRDENMGGQCQPHPRQDMYDLLIGTANGGTPASPLPFAGRDLVVGTADDVVYTGPGPVGYGTGPWGGNNDDAGLRIGALNPGLGNLDGGSNLRIDALYPGANAAYLNSCNTDFTSGDVYQSYQDFNTRAHADNDMITLNALWESDGAFGPFEAASLQLQGGSRYTSFVYQQDGDFGPEVINHFGNNPNPGGRGIQRNTDEFEAIFSGELGDRVTLTLGTYWFDDEAGAGSGTCLNQWIDAWDPNAGPIDPVTGSPEGTINGLQDDDIICTPEGGTHFHRLPNSAGDRRSGTNAGWTTGTSTAVFGHADFHLTEQWDLGVGARWMEDDRGQAHIEYSTVPGTNNTPNPLEFGSAVYLMNRDTIINDGIHYKGNASFSEVTPMVSLTRHLTPGDRLDSGLFYGTISEGYLTGAFNDEINPNSPAFSPSQRAEILAIIPYGPEFVRNWEVGFKGTLFDGRLQLATNLFLMDYTDKQEVIEIDNADGRFGPADQFEYTQNAADVEVSGIEFELRSSPWDGGFVSVDFGTLNSEYANFMIEDLDNPGTMVDVSNRNIANRTPDWTFTASVEHAFLLGNGATLTPQLGVYSQPDFEWRSGLNTDSPDHPICHQDAYSKWRVRASYVPQQGNWEASVFGYNITDEETLLRCNPGRSGAFNMFYDAPAQWGAEFHMRFGDN